MMSGPQAPRIVGELAASDVIPEGPAPHDAEVRSAFHHAHLMEVEASVVLEEQVRRDLAVDRERLEAMDVRGPELQPGAAMKVVVPFHTALAEEPRVIAVVVRFSRRCMKSPLTSLFSTNQSSPPRMKPYSQWSTLL